MDTSPLSSEPLGYDTNWDAGAWLIVLGLFFVALCLAGVAATFLYLARDDRDFFGNENSVLMRLSGGCYLVAMPGLAIMAWGIARHLPSWGWTLVFYGVFIAAVAFFAAGVIGVWKEKIEVVAGVDGQGMAYSVGLSTLVAAGVAFGVFVGDGAIRSGIMWEVPERIATGAGLGLYVVIAFLLVPLGTKMYLKATS